jgi:hypothetical protein
MAAMANTNPGPLPDNDVAQKKKENKDTFHVEDNLTMGQLAEIFVS